MGKISVGRARAHTLKNNKISRGKQMEIQPVACAPPPPRLNFVYHPARKQGGPTPSYANGVRGWGRGHTDTGVHVKSRECAEISGKQDIVLSLTLKPPNGS
jgi:hypothetical protein